MSIIVKRPATQYEIPDEGNHRAVLVEVRELGVVETTYGKKEIVLFVWEVAQLDRSGKPRRAFQRFNRILHAKSTLQKVVRVMTGMEPPEEFDLETLLGKTAELIIEHHQHNHNTYANVAAVVRYKGDTNAA